MVFKFVCHNAWRDTIHVGMTYKSKTMKYDKLQNAKIKAPLRLKFVCVCCVGEVLYKGNYSHLKQIKKHISSPLAPNHEVSFAHYPNELDAPPSSHSYHRTL
jgi:hypothetical protein